MLGLGLGLTTRSVLGGVRGGLPDGDLVLIVLGDSNARGSAAAADQTAFNGSYVADTNALVMNASWAWVPYTPGTITGTNALATATQSGPEIGFLRRFRELYPTRKLHIAKMAYAGSYQSRAPALGTFTGSLSGNQLTVTVGTVTAGNIFDGAVGANGRPLYVASGSGPYFIQEINSSGGVSITDGSESRNKYDGFLSWSSDNSLTYNGHSGGITNGYRARFLQALGSLTNPVVIGVIHWLGTNDMSNSGAASTYEAELTSFITRYRADWPLTDVKTVLPRVRSGSSFSSTVRAAQAAVAGADANVFLTDTDSYTLHDGTHFNIAGLDGVGSDAFDVILGGGSGI